jgi:hypothetical protein
LGEAAERHDPGVVDEAVERPELALGLVEIVGERLAVGDVEGKRDRAAPQLLRGLLGQLGIEVPDRDPATAPDQCRRRRLADPAGAAGDRDHLAVQ